MRIFEALFRHLVQQAAITAIVGAPPAARIFDSYAEQGREIPFPCIVIEEVDDERYHQFGALPSATQRAVRINCYREDSPYHANALADLVYSALMRQEAAITTNAGSLTVKAVHFSGRENIFEADLEDSRKLFNCVLEFSIIHDV